MNIVVPLYVEGYVAIYSQFEQAMRFSFPLTNLTGDLPCTWESPVKLRPKSSLIFVNQWSSLGTFFQRLFNQSSKPVTASASDWLCYVMIESDTDATGFSSSLNEFNELFDSPLSSPFIMQGITRIHTGTRGGITPFRLIRDYPHSPASPLAILLFKWGTRVLQASLRHCAQEKQGEALTD